MKEMDSKYIIYLHSWGDRYNNDKKQYLKFTNDNDLLHKYKWSNRGVWVDDKKACTHITDQELAKYIAWHYGVAYEEIIND